LFSPSFSVSPSSFFVFSPLTVDANGSRLVVCFLCEREWIDNEAWWTMMMSTGPFRYVCCAVARQKRE
jgi:hypothetical protein